MEKKIINRIPNIMCSLICVTNEENKIEILERLNLTEFEINEIENEIEITLCKVEMNSWEVGEVLHNLVEISKKFHLVLKTLVKEKKCKSLISIVIYQYDIYPALIFESHNMEYIRALEADISIDMY